MVVVLATAGCTTGSDPAAQAKASSTAAAPPTTSLASLDIDWPRAGETVDPAKPPEAPAGFGDGLVARMAGILTDWATSTTVDAEVRRSDAPIDQVAEVVPASVASALRAQAKDAVSPRLAVANVFARDVTVDGEPAVTTAWKVSTEVDEAGQPYVRLELQTRAAYEVRLGDDGPTRVIGVLRVHGLSAYPATTDDFGVSSGWQEFGAGDCALALDDDLVPDADTDSATADLETFVAVGSGDTLEMPALADEEQVDAEYLQRCRDGTT